MSEAIAVQHGHGIGYPHFTYDERRAYAAGVESDRDHPKKTPDFARMCASDVETVILHQDAFAADYQEDEHMLLGMAIKYAGLRAKEVHVVGKNRSSFPEEERIH